MNVALNRLDPNVPDPVESRRSAAARLVRLSYAFIVFGVLGFFVVYFGRPVVYLSGPGLVSSPSVVVSLPYVVQIKQMDVTEGSVVALGEVIARVWSPEQHNVVATFMQSLADVTGRSAELRIKERVARESLEVARSYRRVTEEAVELLERSTVASTAFRVDLFRDRAAASKAVIAQEAEIAETEAQLAGLEELGGGIRQRLEEVERNFANGRVTAPVAGIVATKPARIGQSLVAGSPIAEISDPIDIFIDWYVPSQRLIDPVVGNEVIIVHGNWRLAGIISDILPVSEIYAGTPASLVRERTASQIARVRLKPGYEPPALKSTVIVHMHYTRFSSWLAWILIRAFGLDRGANRGS